MPVAAGVLVSVRDATAAWRWPGGATPPLSLILRGGIPGVTKGLKPADEFVRRGAVAGSADDCAGHRPRVMGQVERRAYNPCRSRHRLVRGTVSRAPSARCPASQFIACMIWIAAGPPAIMNTHGNMNKIIGSVSIVGNRAADSSNFVRAS